MLVNFLSFTGWYDCAFGTFACQDARLLLQKIGNLHRQSAQALCAQRLQTGISREAG